MNAPTLPDGLHDLPIPVVLKPLPAKPATRCNSLGMPTDPRELLTWHDATTQLPDADITVLVWWTASDGHSDWMAAWWDGDAWLEAATGGMVPGAVQLWACPAGPTYFK